MQRLPTKEEAHQQAVARLDELWAAFHSGEQAFVFAELEGIIQAPLSLWLRIRTAESLLSYCRRIERALDAKALTVAKRIVKRVRRDIKDLKALRDRHERQLVEGKARLSEAGRECLAVYQSAKDGVEQLENLAGSDDLFSPHERLAKAANAAWEACWKVQPPFRFADCEAALAILEGVLKGWGTATSSSRGQNWESKALNHLNARLEDVFEQATGVRAADAHNRFVPFLNRALDMLPAEFARYYRRSDGALPKRVRRSRSKQRNAAI